MFRGVKDSKLLSDMYEGQDVQVPIGKNILVNDMSALDIKLRPLTAGSRLTSLHVDQFDAIGNEKQDKVVGRDPLTNRFSYIDRVPANNGAVVEVVFDDQTGSLVLVKANGEQVIVDSFPVQEDFGIGPTGPAGERGYDGHDGDDGDDGPKGVTGCEGPPGIQGAQGPQGDDGKDGPPGIPGPIGQEGAPGLIGEQGDQGRIGNEGARGSIGSPCLAEQGPAGEDGISLNDSVVISKTAPGPTVVLWGIPEDLPPPPPPPPEPDPEPDPDEGGDPGGDNDGGGGSTPIEERCYTPSSGSPAGGISFTCNGFNIAGSDKMHSMYDTTQYSSSVGKGMIYNIPRGCCGVKIGLRLWNSSYSTVEMRVHFDHPAGELYRSIQIPGKQAVDMPLEEDSRWRHNNTVFLNTDGPATLTIYNPDTGGTTWPKR